MSTYSGTTIALEDLEYGRRKYHKVRGTALNLGSTQAPVVTTYFYRILTTGVRSFTTSLASIPANAVIEGIKTSC